MSVIPVVLPDLSAPPSTPVSLSPDCEDGGEDETSQPSVDPALHHPVQECEGGLQEGLRYVPPSSCSLPDLNGGLGALVADPIDVV